MISSSFCKNNFLRTLEETPSSTTILVTLKLSPSMARSKDSNLAPWLKSLFNDLCLFGYLSLVSYFKCFCFTFTCRNRKVFHCLVTTRPVKCFRGFWRLLNKSGSDSLEKRLAAFLPASTAIISFIVKHTYKFLCLKLIANNSY